MSTFEKKLANLTPAQRLRHLRLLLGMNQKDFCEKHHLSQSTMTTWETRPNKLVLKSAKRLVQFFKEDGLLCTPEWLMTGEGTSPHLIKDILDTNTPESFKSLQVFSNDPRIQRECEFFLDQNPEARIFKVTDDSMEPAFYEGDMVGGILLNTEEVKKISREVYVVEDEHNNLYIRIIIPSRQGQAFFNLLPLNPHTTVSKPAIYDLKLKLISKIIWMRRP